MKHQTFSISHQCQRKARKINGCLALGIVCDIGESHSRISLHASMQRWNRPSFESISNFWSWKVIFCSAFMINLFKSSTFFCFFFTSPSTIPYAFSIEDKSGDFAGHWRTWNFFSWREICGFLEECWWPLLVEGPIHLNKVHWRTE